MSDPDSTGPGPSSTDVARLRQVVARELETINEYEAHAREADEPKLRAFFQHLADEEKEHVAEAMELIKERDAAQKKWSEKVDVGADHFERGRVTHAEAAASAELAERGASQDAAADIPPPSAAPAATSVPGFTIGSLKHSRRKDDR